MSYKEIVHEKKYLDKVLLQELWKIPITTCDGKRNYTAQATCRASGVHCED